MNEPLGSDKLKRHELPRWVPLMGAVFGGITLIFLGIIVLLAAGGYHIPDGSKYLVCAFFALGAGLSTGFLGADAAAKGKLVSPFAERHVVEFACGGATAVIVIVFLLSVWASSTSKTPDYSDRFPIQIARAHWIPRACDWSFEGSTGTAPKSQGPKSSHSEWWLLEPDGQVDCEILLKKSLQSPYRAAVDLNIMSGEGKGGIIFSDDGNYYKYFEIHLDRDDSLKSNLTLWTNHPFKGKIIGTFDASYNEWISLAIEIYNHKVVFYVNGNFIYEEKISGATHSRIGLRSAFSVVQFKHFSVDRMN